MDIERFEKIAWEERHDDFLKVFCESYGIVMDLVNIWWNTSHMNIHWVLDNGQHISDNVEIEKWYQFINNVKKIEKT